MEIIIQPDLIRASNLAACEIEAVVRRKPAAVLGLATGGTPIPLYQELIRLHREEGLDFSGITTFNLDEYLGLGPSHPSSYHYFMWRNLFDHINVNPAQVHIPSGLVTDAFIAEHCARYEEGIHLAKGIDLQVLGLGSDGHIGFNEPGSSLASRTRIKTLSQRSRQDNARFFDKVEDVPFHVISMGVGTIMEAREIVILAFGEGKARAVAGMVEGPVTANNPASILQMHPNVKVYLDEASASQLDRVDYYKWVFENKPEWQRHSSRDWRICLPGFFAPP